MSDVTAYIQEVDFCLHQYYITTVFDEDERLIRVCINWYFLSPYWDESNTIVIYKQSKAGWVVGEPNNLKFAFLPDTVNGILIPALRFAAYLAEDLNKKEAIQ